MLMSLAGLRPEKDCAGEAQQQLKTTDPTPHQRGYPTSTKTISLKIIKERRRKLVTGPIWVPDTKIGWPTDRSS
jgi:hypothetical protein